MNGKVINTHNLIDKLTIYGYKFQKNENTITFYPTLLNPTKITLGEKRIKIQGYFLRTRFFNRLEITFGIYFFMLLLSLEVQGQQGLFLSVFSGFMMFVMAVLFIRLEILKSRVYSWLEQA
ncbi:MAG: hypothetical protein WED33_01890 [Bacteroidia bacterium]